VTIEFISAISQGNKIFGILHLPRNPLSLLSPCVICSHGLFSSKESAKLVEIGEIFSAQGIAVLRYDHQGCGESMGDIGMTSTSSRLQDLTAMIDLARQHPLLENRLALLGSSMGSFISILKAAADNEIRALALWATPARLERTTEMTEEETQLQKTFYEDAAQYDAVTAISGLHNCLLLHGEDDETVPLAHARKLYRAAKPPKQLEVFPGGDHRFTNPLDRHKAILLSLAWFQKYL
jgi:alpha-beta hydrolase superfamily lysophospholipase